MNQARAALTAAVNRAVANGAPVITEILPSEELRRRGKPQAFASLAIGQTFECNGNIWTKKSTRTAAGIWPARLPAWAYFGQREIVHAE